MPVVLYVLSVFVAVLGTATGLTVLACLAAAVAVILMFRHELKQIKLPEFLFWRTEP